MSRDIPPKSEKVRQEISKMFYPQRDEHLLPPENTKRGNFALLVGVTRTGRRFAAIDPFVGYAAK